MGPYDNAARGGQGGYLAAPAWENGQWLASDDGTLFILPLGTEEVGGPDGETLDEINRLLRENGGATIAFEDIAALGLTPVPDVLRRFSPDIGYYSA